MSEAPERIIARTDYDGDVDGQWLDASAPRPHSFGHYFEEYVRADLYAALEDKLASVHKVAAALCIKRTSPVGGLSDD